jgi:hypothetical protein
MTKKATAHNNIITFYFTVEINSKFIYFSATECRIKTPYMSAACLKVRVKPVGLLLI